MGRAVTVLLAGELPALFTATTLNQYFLPFVSPVTVVERVVTVLASVKVFPFVER